MNHTSIKLDSPIELINVTPLNPLIAQCDIKVCWVGDEPNRNHSVITKEVAKQMANSLPGSPIVGFYDNSVEDFDQHSRELEIRDGQLLLKDITRPYGFVDLNAPVWFQKFLDDGEVEREYLMTKGYLWKQYPETEKVLEQGRPQSMELDEKSLNAFWTKDTNGEPQFFIINEAIISKLCILGENKEPCFEGSSIAAATFSLESEFKEELRSMIESLTKYLSEGGKNVEQVEEKVVEVENEVTEPVIEETSTEVTEVEEEVPAAEPVAAYVLEEIPEYVELKSKYDELVVNYAALEADNQSLLEFKKTVERKQKQALIDQFYMLSEQDKADVVANIDNYSLDDIEAKLSVICFRNKISFEEEKTAPEGATSYSLNEDELDSVPGWVRAAMAVKKERDN